MQGHGNQMNPEGNVPFIVDEDYVLCDSHAIVTYLADKFGNDRWYPKDIKQRKNIQQLLQFNNTMLNMRLKDIMAPLVHENVLVIPPEKMRGLQESLTLMESLIHDEGWLAGSHPTIADCCCAANVSCCVGIFPELKMPPKVASWLWRCAKELPGYDELSTFNIKEILAEVAQRMG
ncbi:glutathione S-transferase 1-like isoform X2 [Thrips palmi]|uniref:Glutathione S-transferase 1-like isoform X2 n=1 Tax=Thrips palmi TaxID=161013 RepID=A0A6P8ZYU8_THRPL|nr:glutathione S-transferase 1-like isoform X2 [Thrips palmi]